MGVQIPPLEGAIFRGEGKDVSHCKVKGHSAVIYAKTTELIEMPFGLWARMGPRNHMLDGVQQCCGKLPWQPILRRYLL